MTTATTIHHPADVVSTIASAEARALADHESGACRSSEWSCSFCEGVLIS